MIFLKAINKNDSNEVVYLNTNNIHIARDIIKQYRNPDNYFYTEINLSKMSFAEVVNLIEYARNKDNFPIAIKKQIKAYYYNFCIDRTDTDEIPI